MDTGRQTHLVEIFVPRSGKMPRWEKGKPSPKQYVALFIKLTSLACVRVHVHVQRCTRSVDVKQLTVTTYSTRTCLDHMFCPDGYRAQSFCNQIYTLHVYSTRTVQYVYTYT